MVIDIGMYGCKSSNAGETGGNANESNELENTENIVRK